MNQVYLVCYQQRSRRKALHRMEVLLSSLPLTWRLIQTEHSYLLINSLLAHIRSMAKQIPSVQSINFFFLRDCYKLTVIVRQTPLLDRGKQTNLLWSVQILLSPGGGNASARVGVPFFALDPQVCWRNGHI